MIDTLDPVLKLISEIEITDDFIDALAIRLIEVCGSPEAALQLLGDE